MHARLPRVRCPEHGVRQVDVPWGAVALCEAGAGVVVDSGWSDCQGQFVEGSQDPEVDCFLDAEFVVSVADVLDESVPSADHLCAAELFETAHRSEPEL